MSSADPLAVLEVAERNELEALLMDFDQAWKPESLDEITQSVTSHSNPQYSVLALSELVKVDLQRHWLAGSGRLLEAYLDQFPQLGNSNSVDAELIVSEFEARRSVDSDVALASYEVRFPKQFEQIKQLASQRLDLNASGSTAPQPPHTSLAQASIDTSRIDKLRDTKDAKQQTESVVDLPLEFGRYRILNELGAGAMGKVYLAHDSKLDRQVALKTPSFGGAGDSELVTRFYREARAVAKVQHRNICPIFDVGEIDGRHFISMAFVKGRCLTDFIKPDQLPPQRTSAILIQRLASALAEAHHRQVIHRDLKPANIMIDSKREPVVMDFGLARQMDVESRVTQSGMVVGTPAYMSPEQIRGDLDQVGATADIYALGVILYELLTGQLPFRGPIASVLYAIVNDEPKPPSQIRDEIDPSLEAVCMQMLAKDCDQRFQSMDNVASALKAYVKGHIKELKAEASDPISASASSQERSEKLTETGELGDFFAAQTVENPVSEVFEPASNGSASKMPPTHSSASPMKASAGVGHGNRDRWFLIASSFFAGGALLLGVIIYFNGGKIELASDSNAAVHVDNTGNVTVRPETKTNHGNQPQESVKSRSSNATSVAPKAVGSDEAIWTMSPKVERLNEWQHQDGSGVNDWYLAGLSPDGRRVAFRIGQGPLTISDTDTKQDQLIPTEMEDAISLAFSSDGRLIATGHENKKIRLWVADTLKQVGEPFVSPIEEHVAWVHLSSDGTKLIAMSNDHEKVRSVSTFYTWEISTRKLVSQFQVNIDSQSMSDSIDASADGSRVAVISHFDGPMLWDTSTGKRLPVEFEINERLARMMRITGMDLSADGSRLAYGTLWGGPSYTAVLDTSTGKELWNSGKQKGRVHCVQFTRDGKWLASTAGHANAHQISLWDAQSGNEVKRWTYQYDSDHKNATAVKFLSFSGDGSRLMLTGGYMPVVTWSLTGGPAAEPRDPIAIEENPNHRVASVEDHDHPQHAEPASTVITEAAPHVRAAAQRILDQGGRLGFVDSRGWKYRLPPGEFRVNNIEFVSKCKLQDADVSLLSQFPELETVTFWEGDVTDVGFRQLGNLKTVKTLRFFVRCDIGDEGLAALKNLDQLQDLAIFHTNVTDDGLKALAGMPALKSLMLGTSMKQHYGPAFVTDNGLAHLAKIETLDEVSILGPLWTDDAGLHLSRIKNVRRLRIGSPLVTDAGVEPLGNLQQLRYLTLLTPKVTDDAIAELQARLHEECRIKDLRHNAKYDLDE